MPQNFVQLTYPFPYKNLSGDTSGTTSQANFTNGTFTGTLTANTLIVTNAGTAQQWEGIGSFNGKLQSNQTNQWFLAASSAESGFGAINDIGAYVDYDITGSSNTVLPNTGIIRANTGGGLVINNIGAGLTTDIQANSVSKLRVTSSGVLVPNLTASSVVLTDASNLLSSTTVLPISLGGTGNTTGGSSVSAQLSGVVTTNGTTNVTSFASTTGTGATVQANTPTLVTPVIGAATGTTLVMSGNVTANKFIATTISPPTQAGYTSSQTITLTTEFPGALYYRIEMVGGGGGSGGSGASAPAGSNGGSSTLTFTGATGTLTCPGGGGAPNHYSGAGGTVATNTMSSALSGAAMLMPGQDGNDSCSFVPTAYITGGAGGSSRIGAGGKGALANVGRSPKYAFSGAGAGGAGSTSSISQAAGGGGGAGAYATMFMTNAVTAVVYTMGTAGAGGVAGSGGFAGAAGAAGFLMVTAFY